MKRPSSSTRSLTDVLDRLFFCPSCARWRTVTREPRSSFQLRKASTLSSSTAINASKNVPARLKSLYAALGELKAKVPAHISLSRLQLAQQGLESESPKIRIAVLGLNAQDTARRVVRLLLADALEPEQAWEKELLQADGSDKGILIRYGQASNSNLPPTRTSISTLSIPSNLLERANIEILVSSISSSSSEGITNGNRIPADIFLSPTIGTPTAASGRQTMISQPVHSTLIVTKGLDELMSVAQLLASTKFVSAEDRQSIRVAMEQRGTRPPTQSDIVVVDAETAEEAIAAIRRSIDEATIFEHKWVNSGMPALSTFISETDNIAPLSRPVQRLILSLLNAASFSLQTYQTSSQALSSSRLASATLAKLESSIDDFSRNAHSELQSGLASAWSSRNWRKLAWYKLFWRIDDVGLIISDLINNAWLPRTEKAVYELSGRLAQAGISPVDISSPAPDPATPLEHTTAPLAASTLPILEPQLSTATVSSVAIAPQPAITNPVGTSTLSFPPAPQPLSAVISRSRAAFISNSITNLTHTAQQLLFRTLSITGLSAGLSGLTYVSFTPSIYESGTIVAFGTAFALYRMQGGWMQATRELENGLFEEGREVVGGVVRKMRGLVGREAGRGQGGVEKGVREGTEAVERAREEYERVVGGEKEGARESG